MAHTLWWEYVQRLMARDGLRPADLAARSGVDQSVIGRWRDKGAQPSPDNVRKIALSFGQSVRQAAVQAGHYRADELGDEGRGPVVDPDVLDLVVFSDERIRDEVYGRMRGRPGHREVVEHTSTAVRPMTGHQSRRIGVSATDEPEAAAR